MKNKDIQEWKTEKSSEKIKLTDQQIEQCKKFLEGLDNLHQRSEEILKSLQAGKLV